MQIRALLKDRRQLPHLLTFDKHPEKRRDMEIMEKGHDENARIGHMLSKV